LIVAHSDLPCYERFIIARKAWETSLQKSNTPAAFKRKSMNSFCARSAGLAFEPASNFYQSIPAGRLTVAGCAPGENLLPG
jgi:hypothetical protein